MQQHRFSGSFRFSRLSALILVLGLVLSLLRPLSLPAAQASPGAEDGEEAEAVVRIVSTYARNSLVQEAFVDAKGQPVTQPEGYAIVGYSYYLSGQLKSISYMDAEKALVTTVYGYASIDFLYQDGGLQVRFYGPDSTPVLCREGYHSAWYSFEGAFIAEDGLVSASPSLRRTHIFRCHPSGELFLDTLDAPVVADNGYAAAEYRYDERGQLVYERYTDAQGHLINHNRGYAIAERVYDVAELLSETLTDAALETEHVEAP